MSVVGVWMPFEQDQRSAVPPSCSEEGQQREAPQAALPPVSSPTIASSEENTGETAALASSAETVRPGLPPRPPRGRLRTAAALVTACALLTVILLVAGAGRTTAGGSVSVKHPATATTSPTATATPFPTPTPMLGFQVYMDRAEGFVVQFPLSWTSRQNNPGVVFLDDTRNLAYQVQLDVPGDATSIGLPGDPSKPTVWLNYAMSQLSAQFGDGFQQVPGPTPAATIGGEQWQSSVALLSISGVSVRVQVYATVHDGKPYILSLWAADQRFDTGRKLYFSPMLSSFQFLPDAS